MRVCTSVCDVCVRAPDVPKLNIPWSIHPGIAVKINGSPTPRTRLVSAEVPASFTIPLNRMQCSSSDLAASSKSANDLRAAATSRSELTDRPPTILNHVRNHYLNNAV